MNTTPQQILNIEDALVSEANPARLNGPLDYERCARLHNYLVAYGWMAHHGQETPNLDELASQPSIFADEDTQAIRERLHPSVNSFLDSIFSPEQGFFYWVNHISMQLVDDIFPDEENDLDNLERFVVIYGTVVELGSHCVGVVYDQKLHRAVFPMTLGNLDSMQPIDEHEDMWFPLETILTNWIYMLRIGKITADSPEGKAPAELSRSRSQIGLWSWLRYSPSQVDSTVAAIDHYTAAIEARIPSRSLLPISSDVPLFTDVELDAAYIPEECFIRSVLTRMKTPRFKAIAPGLEVPHDTMAFADRQKFTGVPREQEEWGKNIPPVLLFAAADSSRTVSFGEETRWLFLGPSDDVPFNENDIIPAGLYSESVRRCEYDTEEAGFRLLLPFRAHNEARMSDGTSISPSSATQLFQHGIFHPFGGERRAQRLERLIDRWRELVESGVWTVGRDGVEGTIDKFHTDSGLDYCIAPDW
ncbi:unnamed protein product [Penicillium nalgiovense]|uniref:Uncharacterized protein n=1 Tax=Penicillium nalgiovense TaxID=60175 RepID=A0A9W4IFD0_PENNA|nr:unnamed protein product [Penicillium nalgiovense]CAG7994372.1 unnamed protein product [Penicillium nalgiovense]CAG8022482.1 unnamed protein product [Penicillium nalgiovense]CAG8068283.1 unnamed protein product [Penicillium nalgiovense]CAG8071182.1 unnamed protein product [Penicillium nalgiovense]